MRAALLLVPLLACATESADPMPEPSPTPTPEPSEWKQLVSGSWTLAPGTENPNDVHEVVIDHDMYIGAIRPIAPPGTHHTVLSASTNAAGIIYASGLGTNAIMFPPGVGLKLTAGTKLSLGLHIYNTSDQQLSGTSGVEIIEVDPASVTQEADLFLPGPLDFKLPPNTQTTATGTCTVRAPQTLFALFPHMHQLGTHFKTTVTIGGTPRVLHDGAYDFSNQAFVPFEPFQVNPGDTIKTECTWFNTLSHEVTWGESTNTEMCFSIMYRYPVGTNEVCVN